MLVNYEASLFYGNGLRVEKGVLMICKVGRGKFERERVDYAGGGVK